MDRGVMEHVNLSLFLCRRFFFFGLFDRIEIFLRHLDERQSYEQSVKREQAKYPLISYIHRIQRCSSREERRQRERE